MNVESYPRKHIVNVTWILCSHHFMFALKYRRRKKWEPLKYTHIWILNIKVTQFSVIFYIYKNQDQCVEAEGSGVQRKERRGEKKAIKLHESMLLICFGIFATATRFQFQLIRLALKFYYYCCCCCHFHRMAKCKLQ